MGNSINKRSVYSDTGSESTEPIVVRFPGTVEDTKGIIATRSFDSTNLSKSAVIGLNNILKRLTGDQIGPNPGYLCGKPGHVNWNRINHLYDLSVLCGKSEPVEVRKESNQFLSKEKWYNYPCFHESDFYDTIAGYFTSGTTGPSDDELWEKAWDIVLGDMGIKGKAIRQVSWAEATKWINRPANSGLPEVTRKGNVLDNTKGGLSGVPTDFNLYPIAFVRTQGGKNRLIQMIPFGIIKHEIRYIVGFQKWVAPRWTGCVWVNPQTLDQRIKERCPGPYFWGGDWSAFDQSINHWELASAYEHIFGNLFDWSPVVEHSQHSPIITPFGVTKLRERSLGSGHEHTNPIGTPINMVRLVYAILKLGLDIDPHSISCQGDDFLISSENPIQEDEINSVSELFRNEFCAEMNPDKQSMTENHGIYLKRWWPGGHFFVGRVSYTIAFVERRVKHFKFGGAFEYFVTLWVADAIQRLRTCANALKIIDTLKMWDKFHGDTAKAKVGKRPEAIAEASEEWDRQHYMEQAIV